MIRRLIAPWQARRDRRRAVQEQSILDAIGDGTRWYAHDICQAAEIRFRDVHALLARLEAQGRIVAGWDEHTPGSPYRRRWYQTAEPDALTGELRDRIDGVDEHAASSNTTSAAVDFALWEAECADIDYLAKRHDRRSR